MKNTEKEFYDVFTDFQCFIIAQVNSGDFNGVTATHYNLVEFIYRNGASSNKQLSLKFQVSQAAISRQVKFLLAANLVMQTQLKQDRRVFYLEVTEKGRQLIDGSENFRMNTTNQVCRILDKEELEALTSLLQKVVQGLHS
ncbi:MarR family winged helix-turn-helix transcriptional regulator [Pedobacter gandavensis]|uniref:MarR family winged helix-turn-helix transcriptional regulator n=1 Tax=Pedobacter gandavensis TaxID=2679963 RepID=UPI00292FD031|nr:MarR family transcriptional regulator [Pedobacter gandavensis]